MKNGASRIHRRDTIHSWLVDGAVFEGGEGSPEMPAMEACQTVPDIIVPLSIAIETRARIQPGTFVCGYEDDCRLESFWANPKRYAGRLQAFSGAVSLDYSSCNDFPEPVKIWNTYRDRASGAWMQSSLGMDVIANGRCQELTKAWSLNGLPNHGLIAIGTRACSKDPEARRYLLEEVRLVCDRLEPTGLVVYGTTRYGVLDYPLSLGIPVYHCPGAGRGLLDADFRVRPLEATNV
ncbi:DUF4417 domain-containing protein [Olsenella sp. YH-ols2217]|uniref:DUF4417 domain-containing protein n=1 Tax=Kribbibacterium absianum TaxID=3044210 RepID=A0ABT6ZLC3_9ACTN|nr:MULTISPECIES: DUF4417 domain-containing protein [unclassified Olsenella]MDJ1121827.1 DUF4417 domain-containing protein [Olsenella sp. YH-ols2216]MDJ1129835.1 DUF4417 domain-containing protein [Olsenella sp. YH-ols2217]